MKKLVSLCLTLIMLVSLPACAPQTPAVDSGCAGSGSVAGLPDGTLAEYVLDGINMKLWLPEGWSYVPDAIDESSETALTESAYGLTFWVEDEPRFRLHLMYYTDYFGICATGMTVTPLSLSSGLSATQYTEEIDGTLYLTTFFHDLPGTYLLRGNIPVDLWERYQEDVLAILDTAVLAEGIIREEEAIAIGAACMGDTPQDAITATFFYRDATWSLESGDYLVLLSASGEVLEVHKGI